MNKCPHCGKAITVHIGKPHPKLGPGWDYGPVHSFETSTPFSGSFGGGDLPMEATRHAPARPASVESDVKVPLLQSLATGAAIAIPTIGLSIWLELPWYSPLVAGGFTVTLSWFSLLGSHRKLLWIVETISNWTEPNETVTKEQVTLEVRTSDVAGKITKYQYLDLPPSITRQQFTSWAQQVSEGIKSPARSHWTGNGKLFSRDQYDDLTKHLLEAGILHALHGKGNQLTNGGRHALKALISQK